PLELLGAHAALPPLLEQRELEGDARRRVLGLRKRPQAEGLTVTIVRERRVSPVRPTALAPHFSREARGEGAAEHRVGDEQREILGILRVAAQPSDEDLRLRAVGLVDEEQVATRP